MFNTPFIACSGMAHAALRARVHKKLCHWLLTCLQLLNESSLTGGSLLHAVQPGGHDGGLLR